MRAWPLTIPILFAAACGPKTPTYLGTDSTMFEKEILEWREKRVARLKADGSWLSLAGLYWLDEGTKSIGSMPGSDLLLPPMAPAAVGSITRAGKQVTLKVNSGVSATVNGQLVTVRQLVSDADPNVEPDKVKIGTFTFYVIERGDSKNGERVGIRLLDSETVARRNFKGIESYPPKPEWRIVGKWVPHASPRVVQIPTVIGTVEEMTSPGAVVFTVNGLEQRLEPVVEQGHDKLFFIFGDETNGPETYGAGRFLYAEPATKDGFVILDFNKAYNPPCAFSPYATCPLPPEGNRLAIRVEAGEKKYDH